MEAHAIHNISPDVLTHNLLYIKFQVACRKPTESLKDKGEKTALTLKRSWE